MRTEGVGVSNCETVKCKKIPYVYSSIAPAKTTVVYDTYWRFAVERQNVFFNRLTKSNSPWTNDPVLLKNKFTNAYRASDRVSQYLIREVIYSGDQTFEEVFFRIILFKLFNKIETWELLLRELNEVSYSTFNFEKYNEVLLGAMLKGKSIYSAAYMMASGSKEFNVKRKHQAHLMLIERMMNDELHLRIQDMSSMYEAFLLIRSYPMIGDFLAYQYVTDINYSPFTNFTEMEFTIPGPGSRDGIRKCFSSLGGLSESDIIKVVAERQNVEFERLGLEFKSLWGRPLQLIDIQNLFCEVDKYSRVMHPNILGISGRTKIKQKFRMDPKPIEFWYPPKWGINEKINCV